MTTEEIKKNESELLENIENINGEDVTLSTSELDNIMSSAEFTNEEVNSEEENLEKYGVWVKVTPEEVTEETEGEASFGLSDLEKTEESELTREEEYLLDELESELPIDESFDITENSAAVEKETAEAQEVPDEETFDIELLDDLENVDLEELAEETGDIEMQNLEDDLDLTMPEASEDFADIEVDSADAEDLSEDIPELVMDEDSEEQIDVSLSESSPLEEDFDDLGALEADLSTPLEPSSFPGAGEDSDSAVILQKIEKELAAIKTEISELKNDLLNRNVTENITSEVEVQPPPGDTTGFFDEEEDETIALTGDELDNILNTAEITEEIAESTEAPENIVMEESSFEMQEPERLIDKEDLIELEGTEPDEVDEIEINIPVESGEAPVLEEILEDELEEVPALEDELEEIPELAEESLEEVPLLDELEELEDSSPAEMLEEAPTEIPAEPDLEDIDLELPEGFTSDDGTSTAPKTQNLPDDLKTDIKSVLSYLDQLLESLPEEKIREFADSEYFGIYKKLFEDLGLET